TQRGISAAPAEINFRHLEILAQPIPHAVNGVAHTSAKLHERGLEISIDNVEIGDIETVAQQAGADSVCWARLAMIETAEFERTANAHRHPERFGSQFANARNKRAAADNDRTLRAFAAGEA